MEQAIITYHGDSLDLDLEIRYNRHDRNMDRQPDCSKGGNRTWKTLYVPSMTWIPDSLS
jgi:hypothetical protein